MPTITHIHIPIILYHTRKLVSVFLSQPEKNSPSFSLSFPGAEGEQHRGIPLTKHPPPPPQHSLTINPLPLFVPIKRKKKKKVKKKVLPFPNNKRRKSQKRKKTKKEKKTKNTSPGQRDWPQCAIVCEHACAEIDAVTPGKV